MNAPADDEENCLSKWPRIQEQVTDTVTYISCMFGAKNNVSHDV